MTILCVHCQGVIPFQYYGDPEVTCPHCRAVYTKSHHVRLEAK